MNFENVKLSSREMVRDICSIGPHAKKLLAKNKPYNELLRVLIEKSHMYYDDDLPIPTLKELCSETGISYGKIRKQIREIYSDLIWGDEVEPRITYSFSKITYGFSIKGFYKGRSLYLEIENLPVLPRIGEEIEIPYFEAYLNATQFHVDNIKHSFSSTRQEVIIYLKPGKYNLFWHYRKDQAEEEREVPIQDIYFLEDYELKKKLGIGR